MKNYLLYIYLFCAAVFAQTQVDSYYSGINPSNSSFVTNLETRIRTPYTRIDYGQFDETNVANFASRDTTGGQRVVTCIYSGYNLVYTPPFAWTTFSREHTWCQSWMPANGTSTPQYSDQHHIFPSHQNNANARRSNHPLGNVSSITYQFGDGKLGTNSLGQTVYEPRATHKGDAARAILYMCVRYDGVDGYSWNFNWLNNTKLPSLANPEAPQDLSTLIQWHLQDPPDKWEVERNNYVQSIQQNRNPFIDHPEWISLVNFNDMSYQTVTYAAEPTNHVTSFSTHKGAVVDISWNDATGAQLPSGYLLIGYDTDNYFIPMDGVEYTNDTNLNDGIVRVNIPYENANYYEFTDADLSKVFFFRIYSYSGNGNLRNYKIDGDVPSGDTDHPLPVELVNFYASVDKNKILLNWETATEVNNYGFSVERRVKNEEWMKIGFVQGYGNSNSPKEYSIVDTNIPNGKVFYRLKQIDFDGKFEYSNVVEVEIEAPKQFSLEQNYPNPFNPTTAIRFKVQAASYVTLKVYDVLGNEIATLVQEAKQPGNYNFQFSIINYQLSSGVYFYRLTASNLSDGSGKTYSETKRMILMK